MCYAVAVAAHVAPVMCTNLNWPIAEEPEAAPTVKSREIILSISDIRDVLYRRHIVCRFLQTIWRLLRSPLSYIFPRSTAHHVKTHHKNRCLQENNAHMSDKMADSVITVMTLTFGVIWLVKCFFSDRSIVSQPLTPFVLKTNQQGTNLTKI